MTQHDTALTPRDIQTRIRSGASLEDLVAESGLEPDRVERFAAPVLAEREHVALTALGSSVRRRGEGSGARPLRAVVAERLLGQAVDADDVSWDAWKRDDAQWQVSADYELAGESRHAEFRFDPQGRFSLPDDDDARWLAGERPSPVAASLDRDDELALVRATQDATHDDTVKRPDDAQEDPDAGPGHQDAVRAEAEAIEALLQVVPPAELSEEELDEYVAEDPESDEAEDRAAGDDGAVRSDDTEPTVVASRDEAAEPTVAVVRHLTSVTVEVETAETSESFEPAAGEPGVEEVRSAIDTLYDILGGDGYAEDSPRVYAGLTDAAAVPEVDEHEFEATSEVLVPVEPDADDTAEDQPTEPQAEDQEPLVPSPGASRRPGRRKRASVPSWDEIMFGGPKQS